MLLNDGQEHPGMPGCPPDATYICIYVTICIYVLSLQKKKKKRTTQALAWVKTQKLCHNCPAICLFSWEREGILIPRALL